jgi:hypothetical protein
MPRDGSSHSTPAQEYDDHTFTFANGEIRPQTRRRLPRSVVPSTARHWPALAVSTSSALILSVLGLAYLRKTERVFAVNT